MSAAEDPGGRGHVGDEYVTYNRRKEGSPISDFPLFLLAQRKRKRHKGKQREGQSERLSVRQRGC
jgi:hypothetical protein